MPPGPPITNSVGRPAGAEELPTEEAVTSGLRFPTKLLLWNGHPPGGLRTVLVGGMRVALVAVSGGAVLWPALLVLAAGTAIVVVIGGPDSGVAVTTMKLEGGRTGLTIVLVWTKQTGQEEEVVVYVVKAEEGTREDDGGAEEGRTVVVV